MSSKLRQKLRYNFMLGIGWFKPNNSYRIIEVGIPCAYCSIESPDSEPKISRVFGYPYNTDSEGKTYFFTPNQNYNNMRQLRRATIEALKREMQQRIL